MYSGIKYLSFPINLELMYCSPLLVVFDLIFLVFMLIFKFSNSRYSNYVSNHCEIWVFVHETLIYVLISDKNSCEMLYLDDEDSLGQSMDKLVKRYFSLFVLPSYQRILSLLALFCIVGGYFSAFFLFPLVYRISLGFYFVIVTLISDYLVSKLILDNDPIYDLRRTSALSFFCWVIWFFFIFIGFAISKPAGFNFSVKCYLLGFPATLILRLLVLYCTSSKSYIRSIVAAVLQPVLCVIPFMLFWLEVNQCLSLYLFLLYSSAISFLFSFIYISLLNNVGKQMVGFSSLPFFKTFLVNWITGLNTPFEKFLEKIGERQDVEISMLRFDTDIPKAAIIVPHIHPGPFKNVGSSLLPSMIKTAVEQKIGCVVGVPHGLLGHELDLASQKQNQKVIRHILDDVKFEIYKTKATPFVTFSNNLATACCQIFGESALISFTLAPKTTEDLPQKLGQFVREKAKKHGIPHCIIANAHNSLNGTVNNKEALTALKDAASNCLKKTVSFNRFPFKVGSATVNPTDFSLIDGMGPGGITSIVVEVDGQKAAYIVIDGNNIISGLREKILSNIKSQGIDEGEILTTDTHSVNALILSGLGYHPIGEVMDHELLIKYIQKATNTALSNLEMVNAGGHAITVPSVKVIGEKMLKSLSQLANRTFQRAKKLVVPIFASAGVLLMVFLGLL